MKSVKDIAGTFFLTDVVKCFLAIIIMVGHLKIIPAGGGIVHTLYDNIFQFALPLFFLFSGFFFCLKANEQPKGITWVFTWKRIKRIIILYGVWLLPNIPTIFLKFKGTSILWFILNLCFSGIYMGSWFLTSLIWCMVIVFLLRRITSKFSLELSMIVGLVLYLIYVNIIPDYLGIMSLVTHYSFVRGLLFFSMGGIICNMRWNPYLLLSLLCVFCFIFSKTSHYRLACIPFFICTFLAGASCLLASFHGSSKIGQYLRYSSTIIYLGHPSLSIAFRHLFSMEPILVFLISLTLLLFLSFFVFHFENKWRVLKYLR